MTTTNQTTLGLLRLTLGLIFLWAFVDKIFGLGFATESGKAWVDGVSPTLGFLKFGTAGPLAGIYQSLAGNHIVDLLFMGGLLGVGLALTLGIGVTIAGYAGAVQMLLMYLAILPKEHHPFLDEHVSYGLCLLLFTQLPVGDWLGFGKSWSKTKLVKRYPILR